MIEQFHGKIELTCDECGEISGRIEAAGNADVLRTDAKAKGWRRFQRDGQWVDACDACVANWARRQHGQGNLL